MKKIILLICAIILSACSFTASREYDQNLSKWQAAKIDHYRYQLSISCFCGFMDDMPVTIEVQNGKALSIVSVKGTPVDSINPFYSTIESYSTMDHLLVQLKSSLKDADKVSVTYDPTYGFPTSISIDQIKAAVDDELFITVEKFEILK